MRCLLRWHTLDALCGNMAHLVSHAAYQTGSLISRNRAGLPPSNSASIAAISVHVYDTLAWMLQSQNCQEIVFQMPRHKKVLFHMLVAVLSHALAQLSVSE